MIVSVNWLKKFVDIDIPVDELAEQIGARLVEIEAIQSLADKYKGVVVVKVIECSKLSGSDHLSLTMIDDGGRVKDVERDKRGYVQVVCGAPNIKKGQTVAWLPPRSIVPETYGTKEPFELGARKLMGHMSNGMIASALELDLFDDHTGIVVLDPALRAGDSFAEALELNDYLLDIENKSLTHRPDAFGVIGFAREVAGILGKQFKTPNWLKNESPTIATANREIVSAKVENQELSDRYMVVVLDNIDVSKRSPLWMQSYLARSNVRPINVVVDVLNYTMLLTGQPMHAFDYDKTIGLNDGTADINVRVGNGREELELLDGRTITPSKEDIVIAAGKTPIGLAGAMGGASTTVDVNTKRIILESATFNLYNLRATQMRHGIFSEAITRFTKGQPAALAAPVLAETINLLNELAGAQVASPVVDVYQGKKPNTTISVTLESVNQLLGSDFTTEQATNTLENVEFDVSVKSPATLLVTAPYWRADINIPEDVIEEIGRLDGFDNIKPLLPSRSMLAVRPGQFDDLRSRIRHGLVRAGANEVLTYSFIHGDIMRQVGQNEREAYKITNSISPELQYYRQSLTPSLLSHVYSNIRAGYKQFALFELNKIHTKKEPTTADKVPAEIDSLGFVITSATKQPGAAYYFAKQHLEYIASILGIELGYTPLEENHSHPTTQGFEYRRSARVFEKQSKQRLGVIGEYRRSVQKAFKLPDFTAGFELDLRSLHETVQDAPIQYSPLSKYPSTERDICFKVASTAAYADVYDMLVSELTDDEFITEVEPVDIYYKPGSKTKNITLRAKIGSYQKTLTHEEVNTFFDAATERTAKRLNATIV